MFEKCGLRDIFCGFGRAKWVILAAVLIFACIGGVRYYTDKNAAAALAADASDDREVHAGYAFYYLSGQEAEILPAADQKRFAKSYIDLMMAIPSREAILKELLEKNEEKELIEQLDPELYADGVTRLELWENSYFIETWSSDNILRVKAVAQTKKMCKELLHICRNRLEAIDGSTPDTALAFEGEYYKRTTAGSVSTSEKKATETVSSPSASRMILWPVIGAFLGVLISVIGSVLFPVINRASDFELYETEPFGEFSLKTAPQLARIMDKTIQKDDGVIAFATGMKNGAKLQELLPSLVEELNKLGRNACLENEENKEGKTLFCAAVCPDQNAEASDLCAKADLVILAEQKGRSLHSRLDETKHYLSLLGIEPKGAVLIA